MKTQYLWLLALAAALTGCSKAEKIDQNGSDVPAVQAQQDTADVQPRPSATPVLIGEGGPRFDACQATGQVRGLGRRPALDVLDAPFDDAKVTGTIADGQKVFICTRTIDQQWLGVVIPAAAPQSPAAEQDPASEPDAASGQDTQATAAARTPTAAARTPTGADCGVASPVRTKRYYDGPCKSGWVESNYIKLIAG